MVVMGGDAAFNHTCCSDFFVRVNLLTSSLLMITYQRDNLYWLNIDLITGARWAVAVASNEFSRTGWNPVELHQRTSKQLLKNLQNLPKKL